MKKFLSLAMMAVAVLVAATFVSCGNDDDDSSSQPFTFTVNYTTGCTSQSVYDYVAKFYQNIVGSDATVSAATVKGFTISCTTDKKDVVYKKIEAAEFSGLSDYLTKNSVCYFYVGVVGGEKTLRYEFNMGLNDLIPGTYTGTVDGKLCTLVVKSSTDECKTFPATANYDGKDFPGVVKYLVSTIQFLSDEKDEGTSTSILNLVADDAPHTAYSADCKTITYIVSYKNVTYHDIVFTRQ